MAEQKASFTVGVFGVIVRRRDLEREILVNVRTDQQKQREIAGLPADWSGVIVDLPGGGVLESDDSLESALMREVKEETGCSVDHIYNPVGPFIFKRDLAFAYPVTLVGEPVPGGSEEALEHRWVTINQLVKETEVRFPGKGKGGRMFKMTVACS